MKLKTTAAVREEVKSHRALLEEMLKNVMVNDNKFGKLVDSVSALQIEINGLEAAEPTTESARMLAEKRTELELCERRLAERQPNTNAVIALQGVLRETTQLMNRVLPPTFTDFLAPIIAAIRPFCTSDAQAAHLARQTYAYKYLHARLFMDYGMGNVMAMTQNALRRCDEILAGEIAWSFDPKIS